MALTALVAVLSGCGRSETPPYPVERLIAADPTASFVREQVVEYEDAWRWEFSPGQLVPGWRLNRSDLIDPGATGGLVLQARDKSEVLFTRELGRPATEIDIFELVGQMSRGQAILEWRRAGEEYAPERRFEIGVEPSGEVRPVRFSVIGHPLWRGEIAEVRIGLSMAHGTRFELREIGALRAVLREDRLAEVLAGPWKIDLDSEVRNALLSLPGVPIRKHVDVPPEAELRFGYAVEGSADRQVTFRAAAVRANGETVELFEDRPRLRYPSVWHDAVVDLSALSGEPVELVLSTEVEGQLDPRRGFPLWSNPEVRQAEPEARNVILISLDTLRADRLSLYGHDRPTSPEIEAWARQRATVFETAVASASWTLPAHASIFTGLNAHRHGVNHNRGLPPGLLTLAEILREAGYSTAAMTGGGFVHPHWGFDQGFDRYRYFGEAMGHEDELETLLGKALEHLAANRQRPFFLFFHTYEIHNPYVRRQPFFDRFNELGAAADGCYVRIDHPEKSAADGFRDRRSFTLLRRGEVASKDSLPPELSSLPGALYDSGIAYTDQQIGRLLRALEENGLAERTVVVLTSDHGEMLGEHGLVSHSYLYEENLLVPLIVADPTGRGVGRRVTRQVRSIDVMPGILDLVGLEVPQGIDGVSLVPLMEGKSETVPREALSYAASSNFGISLRLQDGWKLIFDNTPWSSTAPPAELYDLRSDPREAHNLATEAVEKNRALHGRLRKRLERESSGLFVHFDNDSAAGPLRGTLRGPELAHARVKTICLDCRYLSFVRQGVVEFAIPAGTSLTIFVESVGLERLTVEIAASGERPAFSTTVTRAPTTRERHVTWQTDRGWQISPGAGGSPQLTLNWRGHSDFEEQEAVPEIADELRRQLKTLGYVP